MQRGSERLSFNTRLVLLAGFGGLLLLMALAGVDAIRNLTQIQSNNDEIRQDFLARNRVLNQLRGDVYLSGTYVRDYVLDPAPGNAEEHRTSLNLLRHEIDFLMARYVKVIGPVEAKPLARLEDELAKYWKVLDPVFQWTPDERRDRGYAFLESEVFPRRMTMLRIADQIAALNEEQAREGNRRVGVLFQDFEHRLSIALGVTLALGLILAGFSMWQILRLEREAEQRYSQLASAQEQMKELSARLVDAQETERKTISRELHDEIGQSLSALLLGLGNLSAAIRRGETAELKGDVESLRGLAENSVAVVRNMALLLRPSMLDDLGLLPALQWQAREVSKRTGMRVDVEADEVSDDLPDDHKTCIYRVAQEALHNASRHSEAKTAKVRVLQEESRLLMTVEDDGKGFDPQREKGMGMLGMHERVTRLGGTFQVQSKHGQGTLVRVTLPLPAFEGKAPVSQGSRLTNRPISSGLM